MAEAARQIHIEGDARESVLVTGDHARIEVHYHSIALEGPAPAPLPAIGANPYRGLEAFTERDADRFFGREALTDKLWQLFYDLHQTRPGGPPPVRLLPVLGPSGCGKSSLVRAGLIAELARRPLPGRSAARVIVLTPGSHPITQLAAALARLATGDETPLAKTAEFADRLRAGGGSGADGGLSFVAAVLPEIADRPLIVLIDQFEEAYSLCDDEAERDAFVATVLDAATDRSGRVSVILAMRSDFLGATNRHPRLSRLLAGQGVLVPVMSEDELRRAITEPAARADHPLDPATTALLVGETEGREGSLPLLQFVLTRIWEGLAEGIPPAETVEALGGVGGALAGEAQRLFDGLSEGDQQIARRAFLAMVRFGEGMRDTRRRAALSEIVAHGEDAEHVLNVLRVFSQPDKRLITLAAEPDGRITAEVTHEALFEHWTALQGWLDANREDVRFHRRLAAAAEEWQARDRPDGLLWRPPLLDLLRGYQARAGGDMTSVELAFWRAADGHHRRARWLKRGAVAALALLTAVAGTSAFVANRERDNAVRAEQVARAQTVRAERRFEDVRKLANDLIFQFHDGIAKLPGSTPLRAQLVDRAREYLDKLAKEAGDDAGLLQELAAAYVKVGDVAGGPSNANLGDLDGALASYRRALAIRTGLAAGDPDNAEAQRGLGLVLERIGRVLAAKGEREGAMQAYQKALALATRLARAHPQKAQYFRDVALSHVRLGDMLRAADDLDGALAHYRTARRLTEKLLELGPENVSLRRDLAAIYDNVAGVVADRGERGAALDFYRRALALRQWISGADERDATARREVAVSHEKLGGLLAAGDDWEGALRELARAEAIRAELAGLDPANVQLQRDLAVARERAGRVLVQKADPGAAIERYRTALPIRRGLAGRPLAERRDHRDLADLLIWLGEAAMSSGDAAAARASTGEALAVLRELADRSDAPAEDLNDYAWLLLTALPPDLRNVGTALAYAKRAVAASNGGDPYILDTLAMAHHLNGENAEAVRLAEKAVRLAANPSKRKALEENLQRFSAALRQRPATH